MNVFKRLFGRSGDPPENRDCPWQAGMPGSRIGDNGIALVVAMVILLALTTMGLMMIATMSTESRVSGAEKDNAQALYLAEAGVAKVREWIQYAQRFQPTTAEITNADGAGFVNTPAGSTFMDCSQLTISQLDSLSPNGGNESSVANGCQVVALSAATAPDFFAERFVVNAAWQYIAPNWSQFADVDANGTQDAFNRIDGAGSDVPALLITNKNFLTSLFGPGSGTDLSSIGVINSIEIFPPMGNGQSPGVVPPRPLCTVRVTATTNGGATKTIESEIWESINLPMNGGAESGAAAGWQGAGSVHWGPVMVNGPAGFDFSKTPSCAGGSPDPWYSATVAGLASRTNGSPPGGNPCPTADCVGCSASNFSNSATIRPWAGYAIYQNYPGGVKIDNWNLPYVKNYTLSQGDYYIFTGLSSICQGDGAGNCLSGGKSGSLTKILPTLDQHTLVYLDGQPNNVYSLGVATISLPGPLMLDMVLDVDPSDTINPPSGSMSISAVKPDGTTTPLNVNLDGILYTTGQFGTAGNPVIYGAVLANGIDTHGVPQIYYDASLKQGRANLPRTGKGKWREITQ